MVWRILIRIQLLKYEKAKHREGNSICSTYIQESTYMPNILRNPKNKKADNPIKNQWNIQEELYIRNIQLTSKHRRSSSTLLVQIISILSLYYLSTEMAETATSKQKSWNTKYKQRYRETVTLIDNGSLNCYNYKSLTISSKADYTHITNLAFSPLGIFLREVYSWLY